MIRLLLSSDDRKIDIYIYIFNVLNCGACNILVFAVCRNELFFFCTDRDTYTHEHLCVERDRSMLEHII